MKSRKESRRVFIRALHYIGLEFRVNHYTVPVTPKPVPKWTPCSDPKTLKRQNGSFGPLKSRTLSPTNQDTLQTLSPRTIVADTTALPQGS